MPVVPPAAAPDLPWTTCHAGPAGRSCGGLPLFVGLSFMSTRKDDSAGHSLEPDFRVSNGSFIENTAYANVSEWHLKDGHSESLI